VTDQPGEREDHADRKHTDDGRRERSGTSTEEEPPTEPRVETDNGDRKQSGTSTEEEPPTEPTVETDNGDRKQSGTSTEEEPPTEPTVETDKGRAAASEASGDSEHPQRETAGGADPRDRDDEEERRKSAEEFAREHDPAKHDISAGEESRQTGDWNADEAGGPQVWDADGNLVEGATPGEPRRSHEQSDHDNGDADADSRRTSALEEVRDGGYGVGSAAIIDDGAIPLGHPVKAWEDTKTFVTPDHPTYGHADPHLWFTDADAAQRAGFRGVD